MESEGQKIDVLQGLASKEIYILILFSCSSFPGGLETTRHDKAKINPDHEKGKAMRKR